MTVPHMLSTVRLHDLPAEDDFVLAGRPLRPGITLAQTSRFVEDVWQLEPSILQHHIRTLTVDFTTVPSRYRLHAKQLCYAMLTGPLPAGEKRQSPASAHRALGNVRRFLHWLEARSPAPGCQPHPALATLTGQDLADYHRHLLSLSSPTVRDHGRAGVRLLYRYRARLSDPLLIDPQHVASWTRRTHGSENSTDRIPEPVLGPLITWALRFVDEFAPDILAADQRQRDYHARARVGRHGHQRDTAAAVQSYLDSHVRDGHPLPGYQGRPNIQFIASEIGCSASALHQRYRDTIHHTATTVGTTEDIWLGIPIQGQLGGAPWISDVALHLPSQQHPLQSARKLARMLHIACHIAIAFLSGMRDSEVKHLRRGCVTILRATRGRPYRWTMTSLAFKGEANPAGTPATWVVGHPAARAAAASEALQPIDQPLLFAPLPHGTTLTPPHQAHATGATNHQLNEFVTWVNDYCSAHGREDGIPRVNGQPWTLSTRQFRRTLAWFIARRPGGSIAGAIAYRHLSVQMFEGYANPRELHQTGEKTLVA